MCARAFQSTDCFIAEEERIVDSFRKGIWQFMVDVEKTIENGNEERKKEKYFHCCFKVIKLKKKKKERSEKSESINYCYDNVKQ